MTPLAQSRAVVAENLWSTAAPAQISVDRMESSPGLDFEPKGSASHLRIWATVLWPALKRVAADTSPAKPIVTTV